MSLIEDLSDGWYCRDCGEPIDLIAAFRRIVRADPARYAAQAGVDDARGTALLKRDPVILPGACSACGGGRVARRTGKD